MKVLFVCLGNICRSPMAEGIFRKKVALEKLPVTTDSCGTSANHVGESPDRRAIQCLDAYGVDIRDLKARQFKKEDFERFDVIYAMDTSNYRDITRMAISDAQKQKVILFLQAAYGNNGGSVPDPWYGDEEGFHTVYHMINGACDILLTKLSPKV